MFENRILVLGTLTSSFRKEVEEEGFMKHVHAVEDINTSMNIPPMVRQAPCLVIDGTSFVFGHEEIMEYLQKVYNAEQK